MDSQENNLQEDQENPLKSGGQDLTTAPASSKPSTPECVCHDSSDKRGWYYDRLTNAGRVCEACAIRKEAEERRQSIEIFMYDSGIPLRYWTASLSDLDTAHHPDVERLVDSARRYVIGWLHDRGEEIEGYDEYKDKTAPPDWLAILGKNGTGKSHVAAAIARGFNQYGCEARYWYVPDLLDELRRGYFTDSEDEEGNRVKGGRYYELMDKLKGVTVLVLDDVGAEKASEWADEALDKVLDYRYREEKLVVLTTNVGMDELPKRLADRIQDNANCMRVVVKAPSYRPKKEKR